VGATHEGSSMNQTHCPPCTGDCNQGRTCAARRYDGTSRDTQPGELLKILSDPPTPAPSSAVGFVLGVAAIGLVAFGWLTVAVCA
jgi:hypothetical protein